MNMQQIEYMSLFIILIAFLKWPFNFWSFDRELRNAMFRASNIFAV